MYLFFVSTCLFSLVSTVNIYIRFKHLFIFPIYFSLIYLIGYIFRHFTNEQYVLAVLVFIYTYILAVFLIRWCSCCPLERNKQKIKKVFVDFCITTSYQRDEQLAIYIRNTVRSVWLIVISKHSPFAIYVVINCWYNDRNYSGCRLMHDHDLQTRRTACDIYSQHCTFRVYDRNQQTFAIRYIRGN